MRRILLSVPHMGGSEESYVQQAFATNWHSTVGPNVAFDSEFSFSSGRRLDRLSGLRGGNDRQHRRSRLRGQQGRALIGVPKLGCGTGIEAHSRQCGGARSSRDANVGPVVGPISSRTARSSPFAPSARVWTPGGCGGRDRISCKRRRAVDHRNVSDHRWGADLSLVGAIAPVRFEQIQVGLVFHTSEGFGHSEMDQFAALRTDATIDSHRSNRIIPGWQSRMSFEAKAANLL